MATRLASSGKVPSFDNPSLHPRLEPHLQVWPHKRLGRRGRPESTPSRCAMHGAPNIARFRTIHEHFWSILAEIGNNQPELKEMFDMFVLLCALNTCAYTPSADVDCQTSASAVVLLCAQLRERGAVLSNERGRVGVARVAPPTGVARSVFDKLPLGRADAVSVPRRPRFQQPRRGVVECFKKRVANRNPSGTASPTVTTDMAGLAPHSTATCDARSGAEGQRLQGMMTEAGRTPGRPGPPKIRIGRSLRCSFHGGSIRGVKNPASSGRLPFGRTPSGPAPPSRLSLPAHKRFGSPNINSVASSCT